MSTPSIDLEEIFRPFDQYKRAGFPYAIDAASEVTNFVWGLSEKLGAFGDAGIPGSDNPSKTVEILGALGQLWKSPTLAKAGVPQHPSSLGQMLVLGGLGAAGGYYGGKLVDKYLPNDAIRADRAGLIMGGLLGMSPGLSSAMLNASSGKPVWTSSFYDTTQEKVATFGTFVGDPYATASINVQEFQNTMWNDPRIAQHAPVHLRAAASGLVQGASNMPGRHRNSTFVTPLDIARVSLGMGTGLASGWLVGKTLGAVFGTGQKTQDLLKNTGMAVGALKSVIPLAYGAGPYEY